MYFFHQRLVEHAVQIFRQTDFTDPREGDAFFGLFVPGNSAVVIDRPYERFSDYECLLLQLRDADPARYQQMHKGTPFGFMSWLAFDMRNYEKGLFYMDAGISEDVRKDAANWMGNPGPRVLLLNPDSDNVWFARTIAEVRVALEAELCRFNAISRRPPLDMHSWRTVVERLIANPNQRTIVSALYVFLLEFNNHKAELLLRQGSTGGSNQPFTVHLFTGGLLFETLLKSCYAVRDDGQKIKTLGDILAKTGQFIVDFGVNFRGVSISADTLADIHAGIGGSTSIETAFTTAAKLRNTTGHNLVWDDIFESPTRYVELFQQVMNAILHVLAQKFL